MSFWSCRFGKLPVYKFSVLCNDYIASYVFNDLINFLYNPMIVCFSPFWVGPIHCEHCKFKLLLITKNIFLYPLQVLLHYQSLMHHLNGNKYIFISNMRPTWWKLILKFLQLTYTSLTAIAFPTPLHGTFILVLPRGSFFFLLYLMLSSCQNTAGLSYTKVDHTNLNSPQSNTVPCGAVRMAFLSYTTGHESNGAWH